MSAPNPPAVGHRSPRPGAQTGPPSAGRQPTPPRPRPPGELSVQAGERSPSSRSLETPARSARRGMSSRADSIGRVSPGYGSWRNGCLQNGHNRRLPEFVRRSARAQHLTIHHKQDSSPFQLLAGARRNDEKPSLSGSDRVLCCDGRVPRRDCRSLGHRADHHLHQPEQRTYDWWCQGDHRGYRLHLRDYREVRSTSATGVSIKSSTSLTAFSPAGAGTVGISVTNANGTSSSTPYDQFGSTPHPPTHGWDSTAIARRTLAR